MESANLSKGKIVIYKTKKGPELEVRLKEETVWLTQKQIAELFNSERSVITKHLKNIFNNGELAERSNVQKMHITGSDRPVKFYNLDIVISVGYRVNSKRATQFRVWATKTLKNYLLKGYAVNEKRLLETKEKLTGLQDVITFLQKKSRHELLSGQEQEILDLLSNYSKTLTLLERYDRNELKIVVGKKAVFILKYDDAKIIIEEIKKELMAAGEASDLFGREQSDKLESIIKNLYQTFDRKELYLTIEEKAAHLLYLTIKDHPFIDGNKRIASFLFVHFLNRNLYLYRDNREEKINDNALAALALLIAVSDPKEKEIMIKIITNLLS